MRRGLAVVVAVLAAPAAAQASDLRLKVTADRDAVAFPETPLVTYRVEMTSGAAPLRFRLTLEPPLFADYGAWMNQQGIGTVSGDARVPTGSTTVGTPTCGHGVPRSLYSYDVELPANATGAITAPFRAGLAARWPGMDRFLRVTARAAGTPKAAAPLAVAESPALRVSGPTGTQIVLRTFPATTMWPLGRMREMRLRTTLRIAGTTSPPLERGQVTLRLRRFGGSERTLARVTTDARGRFNASWTPRRGGRYLLSARTPAVAGAVVADFSCPQAVRVVR